MGAGILARPGRAEPLIEAAERLYAERGRRPVSLADVAREVGLAEQEVYNYVGSEEELYVACHRRARAALHRQLDEIAAHPGDRERQVAKGLLAIFRFVEVQRAGWEALIERGSDTLGPVQAELEASRRETIRLLSQLLTEARAAAGVDPGRVNTETTASAMVGAIRAVAVWWGDHPEVSAGEVAETMKAMLWGGLPSVLEL